MASLGEMLGLAEAIQARHVPYARHGETFVRSFLGGQDYAARKREASLDRTLKLLSIGEKLENARTAEQNRLIMGNLAKGAGLLPHGPEELDAGRSAAAESLGKDAEAAGADNTRQGKLSKFLYDFANPGDYEMAPSFSSKGGLGFGLRRKKGAGGSRTGGLAQMANLQKKIYDLAVRMATTEERDRLDKAGDYDGVQQLDFRAYVPSQDAIEKYKPLAKKYLLGAEGEYKDLLKRFDAEKDPFGLDEDDLDLDLGEEQ